MIDELTELLDDFQRQANRSRCFDHIVNLVVKSLLWQFDVIKAKVDDALDEAECALLELAEGLEMYGDDEGEDNVNGLVDEREQLLENKLEELRESVQPVKLVLVKVSAVS